MCLMCLPPKWLILRWQMYQAEASQSALVCQLEYGRWTTTHHLHPWSRRGKCVPFDTSVVLRTHQYRLGGMLSGAMELLEAACPREPSPQSVRSKSRLRMIM